LPGFAVATFRAFNLPVRIVFPAQLFPQNDADYIVQLRIVVNSSFGRNPQYDGYYGTIIAIAILANTASATTICISIIYGAPWRSTHGLPHDKEKPCARPGGRPSQKEGRGDLFNTPSLQPAHSAD
jgi:hypothetical protein